MEEEFKLNIKGIQSYDANSSNKGKKRTTYTATVRVKGFPTLARTFDTSGEAKIALTHRASQRP